MSFFYSFMLRCMDGINHRTFIYLCLQDSLCHNEQVAQITDIFMVVRNSMLIKAIQQQITKQLCSLLVGSHCALDDSDRCREERLNYGQRDTRIGIHMAAILQQSLNNSIHCTASYTSCYTVYRHNTYIRGGHSHQGLQNHFQPRSK